MSEQSSAENVLSYHVGLKTHSRLATVSFISGLFSFTSFALLVAFDRWVGQPAYRAIGAPGGAANYDRIKVFAVTFFLIILTFVLVGLITGAVAFFDKRSHRRFAVAGIALSLGVLMTLAAMR